MSDGGGSGSDEDYLKAHGKKFEDKDKEKLLTRLRGYESVAKLATETQAENKELKQTIEELKKEITVLKTCDSEERSTTTLNQRMIVLETGKTNDSVSQQALTDLKSPVSSTIPQSRRSTGASSDSFMVLGKSSSDVLHQVERANTPRMHSLGSNSDGKSLHEEGFTALSLTNKPDESLVYVEKESSNGNLVIEQTKTNSGNVSLQSIAYPKGEQPVSSVGNTLDQYIQVFPETSQSGGSNFYMPLSDPEVVGGESCTNSSRRGPMSLIAVSNESIPSFQFVEVKNKDSNENEYNKPVVPDAMPSTNGMSGHDLYSGTGARPKGMQAYSKNSASNGEGGRNNIYSKIPFTLSNSDHKMVMVTIPNENADSYRINNPPMLSYGRQESQTEISALTSFGSSLQSYSPDKVSPETEKYNNLNMTRSVLPSSHQVSTSSVSVVQSPKIATQEEFVIVEDVPPKEVIDNIVIPPPKPVVDETNTTKETNTMLMKELEVHRRKTNQLHLANKEWKDRWDGLKKQKEDENVQLRGFMKQQAQEKDKMRREMEYIITSQKEELTQLSLAKKEAEKAYKVLLTGRSQEKQLLEKLKQDYGTLHQEKRALEIQLETPQSPRYTEDSRSSECQKTNSELETELAVLKRQVSLFHEDFHKEHQERVTAQNQLQKEKDAHQSLETKLKKTHTLLKSRDEDLRQKSKQVTDLQFQVDDLKLKLEVELRRASIYPSMDQTSRDHSFIPDTISRPDRNTNTVATTKPLKWSCSACTFENNISHKKCEICGTSYTSTEGSRHIELDL